MKISELILALQAAISEHGDIDCVRATYEGDYDVTEVQFVPIRLAPNGYGNVLRLL
jgi:hypothetical protein